MSNIIAIITNNTFVVDKSLTNFYRSSQISLASIDQVVSWSDSYDACWEEEINGVVINKGIIRKSLSENQFIVYRMPVAGLAYMCKRARANKDVGTRVLILCVKEEHPTLITALEKWHVFLDTRYKPSISFFADWFADASRNVLLDQEYDFLIDMIDQEYPGISSFCSRMSNL